MSPLYRKPRCAFTLIELLVVVAIISLLIAILLPSLQRARVQTKSVICLSNLRTLGQGVTTHAAENNDRLPGDVDPPKGMPGGLFPGIYRNQGIDALMKNEDDPNPPTYNTAKFLQYRQLSYKLRRMFNDSDASANTITDEVSTCPSSEDFNPADNFKNTPSTVGHYVYPTSYVINNVGSEGDQAGSTGNYRTTNPPYYFGFSAWAGAPESIKALEKLHPPQPLAKVKLPSEEWMIADAWYRPGRHLPQYPELQQEGPYQWAYSGNAFPNFAPHFSGRVYQFVDAPTRTAESQRISRGSDDGETNTAFFDGHAESVQSKTLWLGDMMKLLYGFPGTVNPYTELPSHLVWK